MSYLEIAARTAVGVVFLVSAAGKLRDVPAFAASLVSLRLLPSRWTGPVAGTVVAGEAAVPLLLAIPLGASAVAGFGLAAALLLGFSAAIARTVRREIRAPCRCFGRTGTPLGRRHLVRNGVLTAVAAGGAVAVLAGLPTGTPLGLLLAGLAGLIVAVLVVMTDDLVDLFVSTGPVG